jgi:GAF domain-containing protein
MPSERGIPPADQLLRLVSQAAGFATTSLDPRDIMDAAVEAMVRFLGARRADLWRLEGNSLLWGSGSGRPDAPPAEPTELMRQSARAGLTQRVEGAELAADPQWLQLVQAHRADELGIYALATSDFSIGCITVVQDTPPDPRAYHDALALFAEQVASALEKARLHHAAQRSAEQLEFQHRLLRDLADSRSVPNLAQVLGHQLRVVDDQASLVLVTLDPLGRGTTWNEGEEPLFELNRREAQQLLDLAGEYHAVDLPPGSEIHRLLLGDRTPAQTLAIALMRAGNPLGAVVGLTDSERPSARAALAEFLCSAAAATTIGLENALSFQRESHRASQLAAASQLATKISTATTAQELCDRLAEGVLAMFGCMKVSVYSSSGERVVLRSSSGVPTADYAELALVDACAASGLARRAELQHHVSHAVPLVANGGQAGVLFVQVNEDLPGSFDEPEIRLLQTVADQAAGALAVIAAADRTERSYRETIQALLSALEASDQYTADHANDVAVWAVEVGRRLGLEGQPLDDLELGAIFHDIGKIAIPNEILNKPGKLTDEEFEVMKTHTIVGERIIAPIEFLQGVRPIVRHEHERWDGRGYPDGIAGEQIPLGSRIIFVCDAYHAITSDRPYRKAQSDEVAKRILLENAGSQFDPAVVAVFLEVLDEHNAREAAGQPVDAADDDQAAAA